MLAKASGVLAHVLKRSLGEEAKMVVGNPARILPMKTAGTQHLIERVYRESGDFQWARESLINAFEAGATRVEYGVEWQAVENLGVYRRVIADNGCGMTAEQLVEFFNTFGGGGKPIGDEHANFGVGAKTSLMPWNKYGLVVLSWVDREASMIWVQQDPATGEYGLRLVRAMDPETGTETIEEVYQPYEDPRHGCDWSQVKPSWLDGHGTVLVLLGNEPGDNTILGDPSRNEADIKGISAYLNRRHVDHPRGRPGPRRRSAHQRAWRMAAIREGSSRADSAPRSPRPPDQPTRDPRSALLHCIPGH